MADNKKVTNGGASKSATVFKKGGSPGFGSTNKWKTSQSSLVPNGISEQSNFFLMMKVKEHISERT